MPVKTGFGFVLGCLSKVVSSAAASDFAVSKSG